MKDAFLVKLDYPEAVGILDSIEEKTRAIRHDINKLSLCPPTLRFVPAPDEDIMRVGGLVVCGISSLSEAQKDALWNFLNKITRV